MARKPVWPMTAVQTLSVLTVLIGTGYALGTMVCLAFPVLPLWLTWPVGVLLTFRLVKGAAG